MDVTLILVRGDLTMKYSQLFTKTKKEAPSDEVAKNAQLLIRAGFVYKEMAGVYAYLPLGLRVLENIKRIVREEMNHIGCQELIMTSLQRKALWESTDRWDDNKVDIWFKSNLHAGGEVGLAWSHEEPIGNMMEDYLHSYKDLPVYVYQFQTKLRNELRAKSGIMRGREFLMKDAYSFCAGESDHDKIYEDMKVAYMNVFKRAGVGDDTYITFASGGAFTQFSHEFQTVCDAGEDICYVNKEKGIAINKEVLNDETLAKLGVSLDELIEVKTAEVGNIFNFGRQKSEDLGLRYKDDTGKEIAVWMGSYGIGITRLVGLIVEKFSDERGIIWPESVSPFRVHLIGLGQEEEIWEITYKLYGILTSTGVEVLFDDRLEARTGEKLADADLIGIPHRIVVSKRSLEAGGYEYKNRSAKEPKIISEQDLFSLLKIAL